MPRLFRILLGVLAIVLVGSIIWNRGSGQQALAASEEAGGPGRARIKPIRPGPVLFPGIAEQTTKRGLVCGEVRSQASGDPLVGAGVAVRLERVAGSGFRLAEGGERLPDTVETDTDGKWVLEGFDVGARVKVSATAAEHLGRVGTLLAREACDNRTVMALERGGFRVYGTVRDATGGPLGGAVVSFKPLGSGLAPAYKRAPFVAISDDTGHYEMNVLPGSLSIEARAPGYASAHASVEIRNAHQRRDLYLSPGGRVEGRVISAETGEGIAEARIVVVGGARGGNTFLGARTDAVTGRGGRFGIENLAPGPITLHAFTLDQRAANPTELVVPLAGIVEGIEIPLSSSPYVAGRVVDAGTGEPVMGALVTLAAGAGTWLSEPTESDGQFVIPSVPSGSYDLTILPEGGYLPMLMGRRIEVPDRPLDAVSVELEKGVVVSGIVVGGGSQTEVWIDVDPRTSGLAGFTKVVANATLSSTVSADGQFSFQPVAPGRFTVVAEDPAGGRASQIVEVGQAGLRNVQLDLELEAGLRGHISTSDGSYPSGLEVSIVALDEQPNPLRRGGKGGRVTTPVGGNGDFSYAALGPSRYQLSVLFEGQPVDFHGDEVVTVESGWADVGLTVDLRRDSVRGIVVGEGGAPRADILVSAIPAGPDPRKVQVVTEADGRFELEGYFGNAGKVQLRAVDTRAQGETVSEIVEVGSDTQLVLPTGATLELNTASFGPGTVSLRGPRSLRRSLGQSGTTVFHGMPSGEYQVRIVGEAGYGDEPVKIASENTAIEPVMHEWATVSGTVLDADGEPAEDLGLLLQTLFGYASDASPLGLLTGQGVRTDASGHFELRQVVAGTVTLSFVSLAQPESSHRPLEVEVREGEHVRLGTLELPAHAASQ